MGPDDGDAVGIDMNQGLDAPEDKIVEGLAGGIELVQEEQDRLDQG